MKAEGIIQITEYLILNNPILEISGVDYDWNTDNVSVKINFIEGVDGLFKHQRAFDFNNNGGGQLTTQDIINWMNNHPVLSQFK